MPPVKPAPRLALRAARTAVVATLATAVLAGCSVAGTDFQPGVAAKVGDRTVSASEVDDLTVAACSAFATQLADNNEVYPLSFLRQSIAQNLALDSAVRQVGEQYGVQPGTRYERELTTTRTSVGDLPAEQLRAIEVLQTSGALVSDVLGQVGAQVGADQAAAGEAPPDAASDEALQLGSTALQEWLAGNEVVLDPKYGVALGPQGIESTDTSVSFPVSELAEAAAAEQPDPAATMRLPASQRCGSFSG